MSISKRGFASMSPERRKEVGSLGGKASGGNFKNDPMRASKAGKRSWINRKKKQYEAV